MPVHEEISLISTLFNVSLLILKIVFLYISSLLGVDSFITTGDVQFPNLHQINQTIIILKPD